MKYPRLEVALPGALSFLANGLMQRLGGITGLSLVVLPFLCAIVSAASIQWCIPLGEYALTRFRLEPTKWIGRGASFTGLMAFQLPVYMLVRATEHTAVGSLYFLTGCISLWVYREWGTCILEERLIPITQIIIYLGKPETKEVA